MRVVVVDDQTVVREGLVLILGLLPDVDVVGAVANGAEAVRLAAAERPDIVLMDLRMPKMDGVEATRRISTDTKVIVLTTYSDDESILAALKAGARGYITKNARANEIAQALHDVHSGETHFDPVVQRRLVDLATRERPTGLPDGLTPRELDVLKLIAEGKSNSEIAQQLYITEGTVKTHVNNLFAKAGLRDRAQAVTYAFRHGLATAG
ncbi:response regulator [Actinocrispum wychmicini]|uniref:DNA-binding NarL/FixJ family response regulator n=1 Tax=Actinocrispum wychmicini TaxID=1213861 RepID=A0A4R2JPT6_9PSEU|nr:response regulator transcription factor [Actinocrispum wychmicini]TCO59186.1 DNA-binding NarL/FixJ family response regulator [Actinocrispum wychmicini]